jgi:hypothetical protein
VEINKGGADEHTPRIHALRAIGIATTCLLVFLFVGAAVGTVYAAVRSPNTHEILAAPGIADCRRTPRAMTLGPIESTRQHGFFVKREFAGCTFYWHEAHSGGN